MNKSRPRWISSFVLAVVLIAGTTQPVLGATTAATPELVIICVDSLSLSDVLGPHLPYLRSFFSGGAWGLLNTTVSGSPNLESAYLTLGAGTRARSSGNQPGLPPTAEMIEEAGSAAEVYARRTGNSLKQEGVVQPGLGILQAAQANIGYRVELGAIGQALSTAGLKAAVIGSADTHIMERPLVNVFMDEQGYVPYGCVDQSMFIRDHSGPYGFWTDTAAIIRELKKVWGKADIVAVEWADLYRAEQYAVLAVPNQGEYLRRLALAHLDTFLRDFLALFVESETTIMLLAPAPGAQDYAAGHRLTPVVLSGPGIQPGLISSATTRRPGLAANIDIAATVLSYFQLPWIPAVLGRPLITEPEPAPLQKLAALERRAVLNFNLRPVLLRAYIGYLIAVLGLAVVTLFKREQRLACLVAWLLPAGAVVPFVFLILAPLPLPSLTVALTGTVVLTALILLALKAVTRSSSGTLITTAGATVLLLVWDLLGRQNLVSSSLLGYCFISGARYYGLGNEYMGILLGASLSSVGYLFDRYQVTRRTAGIMLLLLLMSGALLLGANTLGSNAGGTLAFVTGVVASGLGLRQSAPRFKEIGVGLAVAFLFLSLLAWSDWRFATETSHIGQTINLVASSGPGNMVDIIVRKLSMNFKLLRYSLWSRVLVMLLLALCCLLYGPYRLRLQLARERRLLAACLRGSLAGSIIALIFNDSGVVAAATGLLYPVSLLILLVLPKPVEKN